MGKMPRVCVYLYVTLCHVLLIESGEKGNRHLFKQPPSRLPRRAKAQGSRCIKGFRPPGCLPRPLIASRDGDLRRDCRGPRPAPKEEAREWSGLLRGLTARKLSRKPRGHRVVATSASLREFLKGSRRRFRARGRLGNRTLFEQPSLERSDTFYLDRSARHTDEAVAERPLDLIRDLNLARQPVRFQPRR